MHGELSKSEQRKREDSIVQILEKEMVQTLGCTDPAGIAYTAAYAKKHGRGKLLSVSGEISANIIKNAAAVCIPKTDGKYGIALAVALGAIGGNQEKELEVFSDITADHIHQAEDFIAKGQVNLSVSESSKKLYIRLTLQTEQDLVVVTVEDRYTNVTSLCVNENVIVFNQVKEQESEELSYDILSLKNILYFAEKVPLERLGIIQKAVEINMAIAQDGIEEKYGVSLGKNIQEFVQKGMMAEDYSSIAMMWTAAATDARMAGYNTPVISNTGSGNQGLASTVPVISIAEKMSVSYEKMIRAVTISSLVTIYIKSRLGFLSAACGATIAGVGTSCGVVYLLGGKENHMLMALKNVLGDVTGMVCDGAKAGCAMKVATCTHAAVMAALMAMKNDGIKGTDGIIDDEEERTIENFIQVATRGMEKMDHVILDIILKKYGSV